MVNCTNHEIFCFIVIIFIPLLLVHNHDFISSSDSRSTKSNIAVPLLLAFLSGVLLTLLCILTIIEFRRIKLDRQSPPQPPPSVDHLSTTAPGGGISASQLQALPIFVYYAENRPKLGKGAGECAICLTEFLNEQTIRWLPGCDHLFHRECIDVWFESRKTCPCCRANVERVGGEILQWEDGTNSVGWLGREAEVDGGRAIDDGRRVGCERRAVIGLFRVLMGRRRHYCHRHR